MMLPPGAAFDSSSPSPSDPLSAAIAERDRDIVQNVREALKREDAFLLYQPVVDARRSDHVAFYEGLIRIMDDTGRVIPAKEFIFAVEDRPEGRVIDCLALKLGMEALRARPDIRLSINMSARSIGFHQWTETFEATLEEDPTVAERLILEITESSAMAAPEVTADFMDRMQKYGIAFAMDDFGAGYTSFRYLKDFFFDIVKLDRGFISGIDTNADNRACVAALQAVATHFEMFTVAEGVETYGEAAALASLGVDCFQGYYFGAPASLPDSTQEQRRRA